MKKKWIEIPHDCTILDSLKSMLIFGARIIIVKNSADNVLGILTEGDLLRTISENHLQINTLKIDIIANKNFVFVSKHDEIDDKIRNFISNGILFVPVISDNRGLIDVIDIYEWISNKCGY